MFSRSLGSSIVFIAFAFVVSSALTGGVSFAINTAPTWEPRETVYSGAIPTFWTRHIGQDRILAYDHHGNPGIAFDDSVIRYARRVPGIGWANWNVTSGNWASLAFDRYERPAVSLVSGYELRYASFDGSSWESSLVHSWGYAVEPKRTSLAFDIYGNPGIAVSHPVSQDWRGLGYLCDTDGDGDWTEEALVDLPLPDTFSTYSFYPSLAFDVLNRPMVAAFAYQDGTVRFGMQDVGAEWEFTVVDTVTGGGEGSAGYPSLAVDPDTDYPGIAYFDNLNGDLKFAGWDGDDWVIDVVDDTVDNTGLYPSLAFDPADGNPAIAYFNDTDDDLMLAWYNGTSWQTQTVDGLTEDLGYTPSLAFNNYGTGFPSIAYFDSDTLYFISDPAIPEPATLALLLAGGVILVSRKRRGA